MQEHVCANYLTQKNPYFRYGYKIWGIMIRAILLLFTTAAVNIGLLYFCKMLWYTYISTPVGQRFIIMSSEISQVIFDILCINFVSLSIKITIIAFTICMLTSAICQVFYIARYLYLPRSFFGKIAIWGLPLAAPVATHIQYIYGFEDWSTAYAVAFVPTLCLFAGCFKFTRELLPEIGDLIRMAAFISNQIIKTSQTKEPNKETISERTENRVNSADIKGKEKIGTSEHPI